MRAGSPADPRGPDRLVNGPDRDGLWRSVPADQALHKAICAEIEGGTGGETLTRVKLADCGKSPAAELLAGLASVLGSAPAPGSDGGCVFVFAEQDQAGFTRWATASQLPAAWPQSSRAASVPVALTRSPLAQSAGAP